MSLPPAIPKPPKREPRWRSPAHLKFVRSRACSNCGSTVNVEAAHVRLGGGGGMGFKPDDFRCVSLCGGPEGCHALQHRVGEKTFWKGRDVEELIRAFIKASPKRAEIQRIQQERGR